MKGRPKCIGGLTCAVAMSAMLGCGGGGSSSSGTTPTPSTPNNPATTITITSAGVSPKAIVVARGSQVTFVNNDTVTHDMSSDPHPDHNTCPEINQAGFLSPGQSRQTGNLNTVRTCGYHDHERDTVQSLQGTITIQ